MVRASLLFAVQACLLALSHGRHLGCSRLTNRHSHYTVPVSVGSPPQVFDAVVDTSSSNIVVPSCNCVKEKKCNSEHCFQGFKSQSLLNVAKEMGGNQQSVLMSHNGGDIEAYPIRDVVDIGGVHNYLEKSLFVMKSSTVNTGTFPFEGILGLSLPTHSNKLKVLGGNMFSGKVKAGTGFLDQVGVSRFSLCFSESGLGDGTLMFGTPQLKHPLPSIGKEHWSLHLKKIFIGNIPLVEADDENILVKKLDQVPTCLMNNVAAWTKTGCGAIPDSSSTAIMGPPQGIQRVLSSICQNWDRCTKHARESDKPMHKALGDVLFNCGQWMHEGPGLDEIPSLHFHVGGANLAMQTLVIRPTAYIVHMMTSKADEHLRMLYGDDSAHVMNPEKVSKVCVPSLRHTGYTEGDKPAWILGMPIFQSYKVNYETRDPASMNFVRTPCKTCSQAGLALSKKGNTDVRDFAHFPREIQEFRSSSINITTF